MCIHTYILNICTRQRIGGGFVCFNYYCALLWEIPVGKSAEDKYTYIHTNIYTCFCYNLSLSLIVIVF